MNPFIRWKLLFSKGMWKRTLRISKKEYLCTLKNPWMLIISLVFALLTVAVSFYGTAAETSPRWMDMEHTVRYLTAYVEYMVPILALILGYGSIVKERERGTMSLLLAYPVDRGEVLSGKFLGLWSALSTVVISGLVLGGLIISFNIDTVVWSEYYLFILASVLLGGTYLSISMMLSVIFDDSTSSMVGSIFTLFLFSFIWLFSVYALAELTFGWAQVTAGEPPKWYFGLQLFNPVIIWYTLLALNIPALREWAMEFGGEEPQYHPGYYDTWIMVILLIIWIAVPLMVSEVLFKRKEID